MLRVYLTDLTAYNNSYLVGKWITLPLEEKELHLAINEVLTEGELAIDSTNHEEYFITDYEWLDIPIFKIDEYDNIFTLNSKLTLLEELESIELKAVKFILEETYTYNIDDAIQKAQDVHIYEGVDFEGFAHNLLYEIYDMDSLPSIILNNLDYSRIARDLEYEGIYYERDGDIYIYSH